MHSWRVKTVFTTIAIRKSKIKEKLNTDDWPSITDIHTKPGYGTLEGAKISKGTPGVGSSTCEPGSSFDNNSCIINRYSTIQLWEFLT